MIKSLLTTIIWWEDEATNPIGSYVLASCRGQKQEHRRTRVDLPGQGRPGCLVWKSCRILLELKWKGMCVPEVPQERYRKLVVKSFLVRGTVGAKT
jgi:hypothetical protein